MSPSLRGRNPMHVWIYGKPGTGKTATCKFLLNKIEKEYNMRGLYINCWENNSFFAVLDKIVRELRILGAEKLNTSFKLERLQIHLKKKPFILFLDEIDKLPKRERNDILYNFCNMGNIGIVAISNNRYVLYGLDERIRSRLNAQQIEFPIYGERDLLYILNKRAASSLIPHAYDHHILRRIARIADGDSRIAIQTLKNAAYLVENEKEQSIRIDHVLKENNTTAYLKIEFILDKLTGHHRMFYDLIKDNEEVLSGELWRMYLKRCRKLNIQPIADRTYSE